MELYIKILPDDEKKWYPCSCDGCGWFGSSEHVDGGSPIADTGDFTDIVCPVCGSKSVEDWGENDIPVTDLLLRLNKAHAYAKKMTEKVESCDCSKHVYSHLEAENREMAKEIADLKSKLGITNTV